MHARLAASQISTRRLSVGNFVTEQSGCEVFVKGFDSYIHSVRPDLYVSRESKYQLAQSIGILTAMQNGAAYEAVDIELHEAIPRYVMH
jgi:hypothetical protein